ncbi:circularly permuted type 2 ATP-grasp protein [Lacipirellula parvula]|uniref:Uncharacterized protein n=1 Tax=Lacipirellula parvula TaxID=2650471 RepID=A0A5K7XDC3_9BACT|nr:circularly permuted type 2 ATP-grasp protein [Lacipirellula parvula]BBO32323.1 hypothetical protein PLANPX_1935 [Lacipirellula parvula]
MPGSDLRVDAKLFSGYSGAEGSFDEVFSDKGELRPAWRRFIDATEGLPRAEFGRRWEQAQRLLQQNSLAYPDPRDPRARRHPWELDAFPLVIQAEEWREVAAALKQRATLLDMVLQDLLGPQRLIREGHLPAEVVFRHPGFLLPYCRPDAAPQQVLHVYGADVARSPDGRWWVLDDRCESPSGAGFALQNRIAMSRMLPDVIHECRVERLAPYFISFQEHLARLAPDRERARVVWLSQLAGSANYFEDAFLARYLGYTLAEAGDLAVRQNKLYLKTLAGLSPVDVLMRRPNSENCDPLELSDASSMGVAGLLQSLRSRHAAIANGLGSGLLESPIFMAFLPRLAETLLSEPLKMPNVATWWCGDPKSRKYVLSRVSELAIRPAYRRRGVNDSRLLELSRSELTAMIEAHPTAYVAQERVRRSTAPVWSGQDVTHSYISLRAFAVSSGDSFEVMPGGLARVSATLGPLDMSLLEGERSKDTWVLSEGPVSSVTLLTAPDEPLALRRGGVDLPSRAAEHFFWLGRQSVRAETLGKLIRAVALRLTSEQDAERIPELQLLIRVLAELGQIEPGYVVDEIKVQMPALEKLLPAAVFDEKTPGTLRATVANLAQLAATVRDLLSLDTWRIIREMNDEFQPTASDDGFLDMLVKVDGLLAGLAALTGQFAEGMTRTHAWRFLDFGRRLERTLQASQLIRAVVAEGGGTDAAALESLLEVSDSLMTYRSRYYSRFQLGAVLDLLMTDETNPRSMAFQLVECTSHAAQLPRESVVPGQMTEERLAASLLHLIRRVDPLAIARAYESGDEEPLDSLLTTIDTSLPKLSDAVSHHYFFHSGPAQRLARD